MNLLQVNLPTHIGLRAGYYCNKNSPPSKPHIQKSERIEELREIVAEMELDAAHYAASGDKEQPGPA